MPNTTTTLRDQGFSSQADAKRAIVQFIWGDVTFAKREYLGFPRKDRFAEAGGVYIGILPVLAFTANVNGHLVVFHFDGYGRLDQKAQVLR